MFAYIYERPSSVWIKTLNTITEDSCKNGRVEITFLFHSNCLISQCYFYKKKKKNHDFIHIKNIWFSSCVPLFFTEKFGFDLKTRWIRILF